MKGIKTFLPAIEIDIIETKRKALVTMESTKEDGLCPLQV